MGHPENNIIQKNSTMDKDFLTTLDIYPPIFKYKKRKGSKNAPLSELIYRSMPIGPIHAVFDLHSSVVTRTVVSEISNVFHYHRKSSTGLVISERNKVLFLDEGP